MAGLLVPAPGIAQAQTTTPELRAGGLTVPSITVPSVSTPGIRVPSISTPIASTPPVTVPSVTTPAVSTPPVTVGARETPTIRTPALPQAPSVPDPAGASSTPASQRAQAATRAPATTTAAPARTTSAAPTRTQPAVTRRSRPAAQRRQVRRANAAAPTRRPATTPVALRTAEGSDEGRPAPAAEQAAPDRAAERSLIPGTVDEIVDALPRWVTAVFVGFALIAVLMAINAYLSARRARALGAQRAALLDDVGLLQTALLAPVPDHAGDAEVSVAYRPAAGPAAGGDFYDVITLGDDRTGLLLGDVSGHGREALRDAALVRYTIRTFLAAGHDPADALARADACLGADLDGGFATVVAAVYDHATHTLRYAKAGHHPPVVVGTAHDPDGEPVSPPLGAGLGINPEGCELTLEPGSTVCLFTDGVIEARRDGAMLGRETLVGLLYEGRPAGPEVLERIVEHADEVSDDLAVCVLRRP